MSVMGDSKDSIFPHTLANEVVVLVFRDRCDMTVLCRTLRTAPG